MAGSNRSSLEALGGSCLHGSGHADARNLTIVRRPTRCFFSIARPDIAARASRRTAALSSTFEGIDAGRSTARDHLGADQSADGPTVIGQLRIALVRHRGTADRSGGTDSAASRIDWFCAFRFRALQLCVRWAVGRCRRFQRTFRELMPVLSLCGRVVLWCYGWSAGLAVPGLPGERPQAVPE